jgi:hypothetical protein
MSKFDWLKFKDDKGANVDSETALDTTQRGGSHTFERGDIVTFKVADLEVKKSQAGNDYINAKFELVDSEGNSGMAYDSFVCKDSSAWKHAQLLLSLGWIDKDTALTQAELIKFYEKMDSESPEGTCVMGEPSDEGYNEIHYYEAK